MMTFLDLRRRITSPGLQWCNKLVFELPRVVCHFTIHGDQNFGREPPFTPSPLFSRSTKEGWFMSSLYLCPIQKVRELLLGKGPSGHGLMGQLFFFHDRCLQIGPNGKLDSTFRLVGGSIVPNQNDLFPPTTQVKGVFRDNLNWR